MGQFLGESFARLAEPKIPSSRAKDAAAVVQALRTIGKQGGGDSASPTNRLLANGHGVAFSLRPARIAQRLIMEGPYAMARVLADTAVDARMVVTLKAKGVGEILSGY